jgi:hypothetical protein
MFKKFLFLFFILALIQPTAVDAQRDRDMDWDIKRVWIPATALTADGTPAATGTGAAPLSEVSTFGLGGFAMTAGDYLTHVFPFPEDLDKNYAWAWRIWYTTSSVGDDGAIDWRITVDAFDYGLAELIATPEGAGERDVITFAADSASVQFGVTTTVWDTVGTDSLNAAGRYRRDALVILGIELDSSGDASAGELILLGVEAAYVPKYTLGNGVGQRRGSAIIRGGKDHGSNLGLTLPRKP